jgi:hypothetical protein
MSAAETVLDYINALKRASAAAVNGTARLCLAGEDWPSDRWLVIRDGLPAAAVYK